MFNNTIQGHFVSWWNEHKHYYCGAVSKAEEDELYLMAYEFFSAGYMLAKTQTEDDE